MSHRRRITFALCAALCAWSAGAQQPGAIQEVIEVTATKIAEEVKVVPQSVTIVTGEDLRARGATDLPSALALVAGLSVTGGGDAGPASSVPEIGGIREADAFLLVVDGVPWGGAFNPDLPAVDLTGVERIEVLRGAAPVMYGATSFTGVIHVIHRDPGAGGAARVAIGTNASGGASVWLPLSWGAGLQQSINANYDRRGFDDGRSDFDRAHLLYRASRPMAGGTARLDVDAMHLLQSPASPHPRQGAVLTALVPLDANHNPGGARLDQNTVRATLGYEVTAPLPWTTTLSVARSTYDIRRGFLSGISNTAPNAAGFTQDRTITDVYFDSHVVKTFSPSARVIAGFDHLYGRGRADSALFDYFAPLDGRSTPAAGAPDEETSLEARRNFSGLYAQTEWSVTPRFRVDAGLRVNHTSETREVEGGAESEDRTTTRLSGGIGAIFQLQQVSLFANYRDTFKPAALDFGPDVEGELLQAETGRSKEIGIRGSMYDRIEWEASVFRNDLENLLVSTVRNGRPALENAGNIRVNGAELEVRAALAGPLRAQFAYAYHDARFGDYVQAFDGVPTQLSGRRFEMSPFNLAALGLQLAPRRGWTAHAELNYTGSRFLNKRNTALAGAFTTWSAGVGRHIAHGELRLDGRNLTNRRDPVAESELGDGQYYRLQPRLVELSYVMAF